MEIITIICLKELIWGVSTKLPLLKALPRPETLQWSPLNTYHSHKTFILRYLVIARHNSLNFMREILRDKMHLTALCFKCPSKPCISTQVTETGLAAYSSVELTVMQANSERPRLRGLQDKAIPPPPPTPPPHTHTLFFFLFFFFLLCCGRPAGQPNEHS